MDARRSGNYGASIWDDDYIQSLSTPYLGDKYMEHAEKLKMQVQIIIDGLMDDELEQLELIDDLQRFDISNHFEDTIKKTLDNIYGQLILQSDDDAKHVAKDLHITALKFRLLRQHGYYVPQDVFSSFVDEDGNFKDSLNSDVKGILSLYEASFLSVEGESVLDSAKSFATYHLKDKVNKQIGDPILAKKVRHALETPLHWRVQKLEAKWFTSVYNGNPIILQLAALDFNMVQAIYQDEIKQVSRWYKETGLEEKLGFARHRLPECYFWSLGFTPEPNFGFSRVFMTKVAVLITIIDDIYDVYGTLDELEMFTATVERWDINALDLLPEYMRICFLALFNCVNELAYKILKDQGLNIVSKLRKLWAELTRGYYQESKWFHSGYLPSMNEYLNTARITISGPVLLFHGYFCITNPISKKDLQFLEQYPGIILFPTTVLRLADDLGTTSDAREYIRNHLIDDMLKKMNKEILIENPVKNFQTTAMNLARIALCFYQFGDGFGVPHGQTKKNLLSVVVEPIPIPSI